MTPGPCRKVMFEDFVVGCRQAVVEMRSLSICHIFAAIGAHLNESLKERKRQTKDAYIKTTYIVHRYILHIFSLYYVKRVYLRQFWCFRRRDDQVWPCKLHGIQDFHSHR